MSNEKDIKQYAKISQKMDKRFNKRKKKNGKLQSLGVLQGHTPTGRGTILQGQNAALSLKFLTPHILQVRLRPDRQFHEPFSYAINPAFEPESLSVTISEDTQHVLVGAGGMACLVDRLNCGLKLVLLNGQEVSHDVGMVWDNENVTWTRQLPADEHCYGLGQHAEHLDLRGKQFQLWNFDPIGYHRGTDPVYYSIPFYMGVTPKYALGVLWDNPAKGMVNLGATTPTQMSFSAETGELRFYLIADETAELVLKRYFQLTGAPPLPPLWAFGYQQSRWSYTPSSRFRELATEFRKRKIPCDVLHFDIDYMDGYRVFTYDRKTFGDLPQLLKDLKKDGFKSVAILDPGVKEDPEYSAFQSGLAAKAFYTYPDDTTFIAPVWAGSSAFPDFTKPNARQWWAGQVTDFLKLDFDGIWNDMNEPTVFMPKGTVGTIPEYILSDCDGSPSPQLAGGHNMYGMLMARSTREGMVKARPDKRPFVLTRCGYAGAQRYTYSWTGDNVSTWDHLRLSISMVMNLGLSGMTYTGPDVGGFMEASEPEMYARWVQLACLFPFFRTHTASGTPPQEPWSFGPEVENIARTYINLRYRLLPYLYSTFAQSAGEGKPMIRPTFLYDPSDTNLYTQDDVFMVGDSLLVAPILDKGATEREFYLPRGVWYDFWTNKLIDGSRKITVSAPLDKMPIFAKAGKVIPMYEEQQYVGEKKIEELHLRAYAAAGETSHYEDSGEGMAYFQGDYRWLYFTLSFQPGGQFAVEWRTAGAHQPSYNKVRLEIIGISLEPEQVLVDDQPAALWFFENGVVEVLTSPFKSVRLVGKSNPAAAKTVASRKKR
ncbi:MAG: glycoside hydrolase family 31 protein [Anaerolineales bacterium]|nr:glycoside hydrolase family 31 protein [Anaerolineales bacterium]